MRVSHAMASAALRRNPMTGGCFSRVYYFAPGLVLVCAMRKDTDSGKFGYLRLCAERLARFGLRSPEMVGLPEVLAVGTYHGRHYAVVRRYAETMQQRHQRVYDARASQSGTVARNIVVAHRLDVETDDSHAGNLMWCHLRNQYVLIDPTTSNRQPTDKLRRKAQWKQQIH